MESVFSGIFWVRLVAKNMVPLSLWYNAELSLSLSLSLSLFNVVFFSEETQKYSEPDSQTLEWRLKP